MSEEDMVKNSYVYYLATLQYTYQVNSHLSPDGECPLACGDAGHGLLDHHHLVEVEQDAREVADLIDDHGGWLSLS